MPNLPNHIVVHLIIEFRVYPPLILPCVFCIHVWAMVAMMGYNVLFFSPCITIYTVNEHSLIIIIISN